MHEFSLAEEIVEIIRKSASKSGKQKVSKVVLEIGKLSGVEEHALDAALEIILPEAGLDNTIIEKTIVPGRAKCLDCQNDYKLDDLFSLCPNCNSYHKEILSGKEFIILSIEVE